MRDRRRKVKDIRAIKESTEPTRIIAQRMGLSASQVNRIRAGTAWKKFNTPNQRPAKMREPSGRFCRG